MKSKFYDYKKVELDREFELIEHCKEQKMLSKGIMALEEIARYSFVHFRGDEDIRKLKEYEIVLNELKALEIIKRYTFIRYISNFNFPMLRITHNGSNFYYLSLYNDKNFKILKGVLPHGKY